MTALEVHPSTKSSSPKKGEAEEMRHRIAELTAAVEARDTFIAIAAHELRNPMTPIVGQVDLLLAAVRADRCPPKQVERRVERIQHAIRHYMKRADVLLEVSRINSGKLRLELEPSDLATLMRDTAAEFALAARCAGVAITVTTPHTLPGTWDRLALEQIIDNLISNALKYGSCTPVEISAELCGEHVRIQVCDHGSGIPADDRERIFARFERAVGRGARRGGFGVGLWVVRQLAEAMGGTVVVADAVDGGALFAVTLPRHVEGTRS